MSVGAGRDFPEGVCASDARNHPVRATERAVVAERDVFFRQRHMSLAELPRSACKKHASHKIACAACEKNMYRMRKG